MVSNKIQNEWGRGPVNYLSVDVLRQIFELCKDKFNIVYNRPYANNIVNDDKIACRLHLTNIIDKEINNIIRYPESNT